MSENMFGVDPKCHLNSVEDSIIIILGYRSKI